MQAIFILYIIMTGLRAIQAFLEKKL